jgi:hypothetical protein
MAMGDQSRPAFANQPAGQPEMDADQQDQNLTPELQELEDKLFRRLQGYYESERQRMASQISQLQEKLDRAGHSSQPVSNALPAAQPPEHQA